MDSERIDAMLRVRWLPQGFVAQVPVVRQKGPSFLGIGGRTWITLGGLAALHLVGTWTALHASAVDFGLGHIGLVLIAAFLGYAALLAIQGAQRRTTTVRVIGHVLQFGTRRYDLCRVDVSRGDVPTLRTGAEEQWLLPGPSGRRVRDLIELAQRHARRTGTHEAPPNDLARFLKEVDRAIDNPTSKGNP